jgi:HAD superfamily hydrolase (TIGR01484 family)
MAPVTDGPEIVLLAGASEGAAALAALAAGAAEAAGAALVSGEAGMSAAAEPAGSADAVSSEGADSAGFWAPPPHATSSRSEEARAVRMTMSPSGGAQQSATGPRTSSVARSLFGYTTRFVQPLSDLTPDEAKRLRGLLFDLDDTLLSHGSLTRAAYGALWDLADAGLVLVAVTGRPSGWGEVIARQWPVAGCVTENGAIAIAREGAGVIRRDACGEDERERRRARLRALVDRVREVAPEAGLTDDVDARRSDVTWDVGERVRLPEATITAIAREIERAGARWLRSSVHLHATFDTDDKASGAIRFCARELGEEPGAARVRFAFVGDSGNDAACFSGFVTTFGVANVRASISRLTVPPRYVAARPMGEGFAEIAAEILRKRS